MGYSETPVWNTGDVITEARMRNIATGIEQNNLFNLLLNNTRYKVTEFDTPSAGDITESIKNKVDDSIYATVITEFDVPTAGDITETLTCADLGIANRVITEFDTPSTGDVTETGSEVP
jgi:hypothetical protein